MSKKMFKIEGTLMVAGVPNHNGRTYSEECLEQMQRQLNEKIKSGTAFIADVPEGGVVKVDSILGQLDHAGVEETDGVKKLKVKGHLLDTPNVVNVMKVLKENQKEGESLEETFDRIFDVRPAGVGKLNKGNIVDPETYQFLCANIFPKGM